MASSPVAVSAKSRPSDATTGLLYLGVALVLVGGFALQRLGLERVVRELLGRPLLFAVAAAVVALPALTFAGLDFRRARRRAYTPPSLRVQVFRSGVYGLAFGLANLLGVLALEPRLLPALLGIAGGVALVALASVYGVVCWYLCLRPREFEAAELPTFKEVSHALRDSNDFVLGTAGSDWKSGEGDPQWLVLPERALFTNLYCLAGTGSGKTSTVVHTLLEQALYKWAGDPKRKIGMFINDCTKGEILNHVLARAKKAGREKDVIALRVGGEWSYNPLAEGNATALAARLLVALETMTAQESNTYYRKMAREFTENAFQVMEDVLGRGKFGFMDFYDFICDDQVQASFLEAAKEKNSVSYRWFVKQWLTQDAHEQGMLTKGLRADVSSFVQEAVAPIFASASANFPGWKTVINEGKIVVFNMPMDVWGDFAKALGIFVLMDFQAAVLARNTPEFAQSGGNTERLMMCVLDEAWAYMNPKLAEFTAVSRSARCCTLALHQGLQQVPPQYRDTVLGNFRTSILLSINDPLSLSVFSRLFGTHKVMRQSHSEGSSFAGVEQKMLTDAYAARAGGESKSVSVSYTEIDEPRFPEDALLRLPQGKAVVQMYDGATTHLPRVVNLLLGTLPQHQLF